MTIELIPVDINPIKADKSGTIEEYLVAAEEYLKCKKYGAKISKC